MPHDILWPPTAQWDGYEEMRFMKTEAPPRLALYVRAWRHYVFSSSVDWAWRTKKTASLWFLFNGLGQRGNLPIENKHIWLADT